MDASRGEPSEAPFEVTVRTVKQWEPARFEGPKLKIERAERHIADFRTAFKSFAETNVIKGITYSDIETRKLKILFPPFGAQPTINQMRLTAADVLSNLRAALDQAVCRAIPPGKSPKGTYFPHGLNQQGFKVALREKCEKVPDTVRDAVTRLEPYYGGHGALIRALHDLNVIDKHTDLITVQLAVAAIHGTVRQIPVPSARHSGEHIAERGPIQVDEQYDIEVTCLITFAEVEAVKGQPVTEVLLKLVYLVKEAVATIERASRLSIELLHTEV